MRDNKMMWWGYLHTSGTIHAKRLFSYEDISEAQDSPFCAKVVGPFPAADRDEAISIITKATQEGA